MTEDKLQEYWQLRRALMDWLSYMNNNDEDRRYGDFDLIPLKEDLQKALRMVAILLDWQKKNRKIVKERIKKNKEYYKQRYFEQNKDEILFGEYVQELVAKGINRAGNH